MIPLHRVLRQIALSLGGLGLLCLIALGVAARLVSRPRGLGVIKGQLASCPATPNCVSTQSNNPSQRMAPIPYTTTTEVAMQSLVAIVRSQPRATVLEQTPTYLAVVYRSPIFHFPDDVEITFDEGHRLIHFRAAARLGRSDLGVNRARMEAISQAFRAQDPGSFVPFNPTSGS
jgi:uncharacterized protein (DUF1499 family)